MNRKLSLSAVLLFLVCLAFPARLFAWWPEGHYLVDEAAVRILPADMPEFFRKGGATITCYAVDADLWKERAVPALRALEGPEHFIDLELLQGNEIPKTRRDFLSLCRKLKVSPGKVGMLPYAIQEWRQRLVIAFAEYRRWPDDPRVQAKILVLAGILSHYTGDLSQPLHCTMHFNGRVGADGKSPRGTIHYKMDALPGTLNLTAEQIVEGLKTEATPDVFELIRSTIKTSNGRVDRVYELEEKLPAAKPDGGYKTEGKPANDAVAAQPGPAASKVDKEVADLCLQCCRTGAQFTAAVWYSAWVESGKVKLPGWYRLHGADKRSPIVDAAAKQTKEGTAAAAAH